MRNFTKLITVFLVAVIAIFSVGCSGNESPQPKDGKPESAPSLAVQEKPESDIATIYSTLTPEQKIALEQQAVDFAMHFPMAFGSTAELDPYSVAWYTFWKLYEKDPDAVDAQGYLILGKAEVDAYAQQHFGIAEVSYSQETPAFDDAAQSYAFMPIGEAPWLELEMGRVTFSENGTVEYLLTLYDKAMGQEMPYRAVLGNFTYQFKVCEEDEQPYLQAISCSNYQGEELTSEKVMELLGFARPFMDKLLVQQGVDTTDRSVVLSVSGIVFVNGEDCVGLYVTDERDRKNERLFECAISIDGGRFYYYQDGIYLLLAE